MKYTYWRGGKFNAVSIQSLLVVEKLSGLSVRVTQGGLSNSVAASAGTHSGLGVIDVSVKGWSQDQIFHMVLWLRRCGWAAWYRTPLEGFIYHIHAVRIGDSAAANAAKAQVVAYRRGRNGLANDRVDDGPRVSYTTWEDCKYNRTYKPHSAGGSPYIINGHKYGHLSFMSVSWINDARAAKKKYVSRPVHRLQVWLSYDRSGKKGGYYTVKCDGVWGPKTQAAFDEFRSKTLKYKGKDATGAVGFDSLSALRKRVDSPYPVIK